ncbi:MAG: thiolase family protein, partial [Candidatus Thorarchaeota archaeon]|jgi:acetyl-CoA C-acetyltransferase
LVDSDRAKMEEVKKMTNINGSAIAIGHANTASGARILMNLAYEIQRRGQGYALGSIGGALGLGDAFILKAYEG